MKITHQLGELQAALGKVGIDAFLMTPESYPRLDVIMGDKTIQVSPEGDRFVWKDGRDLHNATLADTIEAMQAMMTS